MSWWDSASGFTNLASAALKTAQKRIDKVLDIKEDELQGGAASSYTPQYATEETTPTEESSDKVDNDGFFDTWIPGTSELSTSSMLLSNKSPPPSSAGLSKETLSLKDKLEKKRAARAATLAKRNAALTATKVQHSESINKEKIVQDMGHHPQSAFTAVHTERPSSEGFDPEVEPTYPSAEPEEPVMQESDRLDVEQSSQEIEHRLQDLEPHLEPEKHDIEIEPEPEYPEIEPVEEEAQPEKLHFDEMEPPVLDTEHENVERLRQEAEPTRVETEPEAQASIGAEKEDVEPEECQVEEENPPTENEGLEEDAVPVESEKEPAEEECEEKEKDVTDEPLNVDAGKEEEPVLEDTSMLTASEADEPVHDDTVSGNCDVITELVQPAENLSCAMEPTDAMQGSGWDDVSLSILTDSTFSSKCPSDADLVAMVPATEETKTLDSSWEQTAMESSESSLEVIQVKDVETKSESEHVASDDGIAISTESDTCEEECLEEQNVSEAVVGEVSAGEQETGDWDNEDLNLAMETSVLCENRPLEECSSTSETVDSLSESNRTLTADDMDRRSPCEEVDAEEVTDVEVEGEGERRESTEHLSSSSYVKNMLEEAMNESIKDSDSHTSSDMVRIESAQNSGHTSADEIDTTTSSDIEIISHISTPTPNGDGHRIERPFDLSPLRHALSRSVRRGSPPGHKRSDSSSSGHSYHSRNDELLSPDNLLHRDHGSAAYHSGHPLETEKLLKDVECPLHPIDEKTPEDLPSFPDAAVMQSGSRNRDQAKKLAEVSEVLDAREKKLLSLSQENVDLVESNNILRNQLQQVEEAREAEMEDLNALTEEFTQRIADTERSLQNGLREKENIKKMLREAEAELVKRADSAVSERVLKEKEQVISELLEEGEKLSKQQLQSNNIIKKLRTKEKDTEMTVKQMRQKIEDLTAESSRLESILDTKVEHESSQNDMISKLNTAVQAQESQIHHLNSELEDSQERCRSMKAMLDSSYKEITDLHRAKATHASDTQKFALSVEMQAREELITAMEEAQTLARRQQEGLINQIEDLQLSMTRMEKEQGRREDVLRQEVSDLQQRLQEAEGRNQELTQNVTAATRPLLRQIENLQSTYTAQSDSYEKVERNLTERLSDAQTQLASAIEKERNGAERVLESSMRVATLESQLSSLRQEKSRLQAQLEIERTKGELIEETSSTNNAQMGAVLHSKETEINELKREKIMMEHVLETEKAKVESEKKKVALVHEQLRDKELTLNQLQSRPSITPPGQHSREGSTVGGAFVPDSPMSTSLQSLASSMNISLAEESLEKNLIMASSTNGSKLSLYDSLRQNNATALVENLQAQLKQREGEISQLQHDIGELEKTREAMARELVNLSTDKEDLQLQVVDLTKVQKTYMDLDQRYQALLQMYGEKVEEVQELKLDLQDIKEMYKAQINELLMSK